VPPSVALARPSAFRDLQILVLRSASVVFATASMAGSAAVAEATPQFNVCLIDEAAQLVEAETAIVLNAAPDAQRLILVGDHHQLPATVISRDAEAAGYGRSSFERLAGCGFGWVPLPGLGGRLRFWRLTLELVKRPPGPVRAPSIE
jgi:superfamily I DNA and/or RNA helicase